jgi:Flp pilus assembly protein TadG
MWQGKPLTAASTTFFGRLARDARGNTLAMMAIALIPLSALAGSAVDMGRLYIVKTRLQQACDAGVLAGRKTMVSTDGALDTAAANQAKTFFANNFPSGLMGTRPTHSCRRGRAIIRSLAPPRRLCRCRS